MPIYTYACPLPECLNAWAELRKIAERDDIIECPACKNIFEPRRKPEAANFALKGGGWASSGYSKESK
jgi:putative FmdB family regulatory protein